METLTLIANPGSASRKYALYDGETCRAKIHFEHLGKKVIYSYEVGNKNGQDQTELSHLTFSVTLLPDIFQELGAIKPPEEIKRIALRIVAPSAYFQKDRELDNEAIGKLENLKIVAPLHINAVVQEINLLSGKFPNAKIYGVSDSSFHADKPSVSQYYGIPVSDADKFSIKRFGYHGLSMESIINTLKQADKLPLRTVVCHLGSGVSISAIKNGKSVDTSMGFSPLEGAVMATRSGSIDIAAAQELQRKLNLNKKQLQDYLNDRSGLMGLSGISDDIRELLQAEKTGNQHAAFALELYVYRIQQLVGAMTAALGGLDALVFTGTVGERASEIRKRVVRGLLFLGLTLDAKENHIHQELDGLKRISPPANPVRIYVIPADEYSVMINHALKHIS